MLSGRSSVDVPDPTTVSPANLSREMTHMSTPMIDRRSLIGSAAASLALPAAARAAPSGIRVIAFDGFPIFDPRGVVAEARALLGPPGETLAAQWSTKLFGYSWLETAAGRYQDFSTLADAALRYTAQSMGIALDDATCLQLVTSYDRLSLWPDVLPALETLHAAGIRLAFLSNLSAKTLQANMLRNGIDRYFDAPLSTDRVRRFKPSPAAYSMAIDAFGLPQAAIGFAAFGGWDAIGASWFGYRTAWINRFGLPLETVDARPAIVTRGIEGVLALAGLA